MELKLALAQMRCEKDDWPGNLRHTGEYMAQARSRGCDVVVFPEAGLSGYCDPRLFPQAAQPLDSPWVKQFVEMTARYRIVASGGFLQANPNGPPFVTQLLAQNGRMVGVYRKHNLGDEVEWTIFSPGNESPVFNLRLPSGDLTCALAICADSDLPDLFTRFARQGARIVFHSSAPGLLGRKTDEASWRAGYEWYESYLFERLPAYARDNHLFIAVATQTGATVDEDFPGGSFVFGPNGSCLAGTEDYSEQLLSFDLFID